MADVNRHVKWAMKPISASVRGSTVIERGDLLFFDQTAGLRDSGDSPRTGTVFPFADISGSTATLASNKELAADNFIGVAIYDSDSGTTEEIAIATAGVFEFPLRSAKSVELGQTAMPAGSGTSQLYSQKVEMWSSGTTYTLGNIARSRVRSMNVEFFIISTVVK